MFVEALRTVGQFTWPVIISTVHRSGEVKANVGTLVVVNDLGWFLTAAHLFQAQILGTEHTASLAANKQQVAAIQALPISAKQKQTKIAQLKVDPNWITGWSYWWGRDGVAVTQVQINATADVALGRLQPFDPSWIGKYPTFKRVDGELPPGASLCRLGFPFHEIKSTHDPATGQFMLAPGTLPLARFPNEGILTRIVTYVDGTTGLKGKFIETSSPGLRGQSGGPVFDVDGCLWGLQSRTLNLALGFSPEVKGPSGKAVVENQFLNVGHATHVDELLNLMTAHGVAYQLSP